MKIDVAGAPTDAVFNKRRKPDLAHLILNSEDNLESQIFKLISEVKDLLGYSKKLEGHVTIVRNFDSKLLERVAVTERHCWRKRL